MFDDLQSELGIKLTESQKMTLKELARRRNDTLRVYNPLPEDYYVDWGLYDKKEPGGSFLVPGKNNDAGLGKGMSNQPRYIATKFFKEAALIILQSRQIHAINEENTRRKNNGFAKLSRTVDNDEVSQFLSEEGLIINHNKYLELLPKIILGIVHQWGLDAKPMKRFQKELSLEDLTAITDREVGTDIPVELIGITQYKPVEPEASVASPEAPTQGQAEDVTSQVAA
jgi:hypothetical protein